MHSYNRPSSPKSLAPSAFPDIGLSLRTALGHHQRQGSESASTSPFSSNNGSPTSSPGGSFFPALYRQHRFSGSHTDSNRSRSRSPFTLNSATLSFRGIPFLLRRRPSSVDMALSAERTRCDWDTVERRGLHMLEPRPMDPLPMHMNANIWGDVASDRAGPLQTPLTATSTASSPRALPHLPQQPRYVMDGIFEVMESQA
jgi:hypothetical protein